MRRFSEVAALFTALATLRPCAAASFICETAIRQANFFDAASGKLIT